MMTNLLRNKTFVSCLAVVAGLGIAANLVKFPSRLPVAAAATTESRASEERFEMPPVLAIRDELVAWASNSPTSLRDPFCWPQTAPSISTNVPSGPAPAFRLQGVSIEGEKVFAVINHQVLRTGDKLGDYVVERILPREVWMHGPAGRITVGLAR